MIGIIICRSLFQFFFYTGSVTELVARWITQNLLEVEILLSRQMGTEDNQSTGIGDSDVLPDQAPEANKTSLEVSGELGAIQGLLAKLFDSMCGWFYNPFASFFRHVPRFKPAFTI